MQFLTWIQRVLADLWVAISELRYFKYLARPNDEDEGLFTSEAVIITKHQGSLSIPSVLLKIFKTVYQVPEGMTALDMTAGDRYSFNMKDDEAWFFVNGIMTDEEVLRLNGEALSKIFKKRITLIHNPTEGIARDLRECVFGRTLDRKNMISELVSVHLLKALREGKKVRVIGHSQGGIILSNAAKRIKQSAPDEELQRVIFMTIAGAQDEFPEGPWIAEHHANEKDYVARIGCMHYQDNCHGKVYVREGATGHLMNAHYLEGLIRGDYCDKKSAFYGLSNH